MKRNHDVCKGTAVKSLIALLFIGAAVQASAHTGEWYSDNIEVAKKRAAECIAMKKADKVLVGEEKEDCKNATHAAFVRPYVAPPPTFSSKGGRN